MASNIATWVLESRICFHSNYTRLYGLWSKFKPYYDTTFNAIYDEDEIIEWNPHANNLGDEEGVNHARFIQELGSAAAYDPENKLLMRQTIHTKEDGKMGKLEKYLLNMIAEEENTSNLDDDENMRILEKRLEEDRADTENEIIIPANFMELMEQMTKDAMTKDEEDDDA